MDSPSSDTVQTLLVQSQLSLFLFLYKSHLQQRGDNPEQKFSLQEFSLEVNLQEWYSSVNIEGKKMQEPRGQCPVCTYPCQPLLRALSRSCWKSDSASWGDTKSFWSLTNTAPRTCHVSTQQPVPHRYKTHSRELKEDRLGHCGSRTCGGCFTGNLSVWRKALWSWEENTSKIQSGRAWEVGQDANTPSTRKNQQLLLPALPCSREVTEVYCLNL